MLRLMVAVLSVYFNAAEPTDLDFPPGFQFGAATSSYQVEGAWNVSDKSPSIWDHFTHTRPEKIADHSNGDVACDSYHQWKRDIEMAKELGLDYYRFSISWPRLLPSGFPGQISDDGRRYYDDLIDGLLAAGIEPMVTVYHWELPQNLQDLGGWANPLIADWFADYARLVFQLYASKVKVWLTVNEPWVFCSAAYGHKMFPPALGDSKWGYYLCNKHVLLAHGRAWRIYDQEFRRKYGGRISMATSILWLMPSTEDDRELTDLALEYYMGRYKHPVFSKEGGWPPSVEKYMRDLSKKEGLPRSRLPEFTDEEVDMLKGTFDFFGLNLYSSRKVRRMQPGEETLIEEGTLEGGMDLPIVFETEDHWFETFSGSWFKEYPEGLRKALNWIKRSYGDVEIFITENGHTSEAGLSDVNRIRFFDQHLRQVLLAIKEDGVNVTRYTAWSLMDNFEWIQGYNFRFGLFEVDFTSPQRTRTPRASAHWYRDVIARRSLNVPERDEL